MTRFKYFYLILYAGCLSLASCSYTFFNEAQTESNCSESKMYYYIVFSGEMSNIGVDLYVFETRSGEKLKVQNPYNETITPGLGAYGKNPKLCVKELQKLIEKAKKQVPQEKWPKTHLMLVATGISHLPGNQSLELLYEINKSFKTTGLRVDSDSVSEMKGRRKLFSWLGVNLLLGRLEANPPDTAAVLDLGGETVNEAFSPTEHDPLKPWQQKIVKNVTVFNKTVKFFGYNSNGLGLDEARIQIITQKKSNRTETYISPCVHPRVFASWVLKGQRYVIRGDDKNGTLQTVDLESCFEAVKKVLVSYKPGPPLLGKEIYGTSNFYEIIVHSGLIVRGQFIELTMNQIKARAKEICAMTDLRHPLICMDLVYMNLLLRKMYGLKPESKIQLAIQINDTKLSWALGAAFEKFEYDMSMIAAGFYEL